MAKVILGVDIGSDSLKLALNKNGVIQKTAVARMPANLLKDGRITSPQAMGEVIRGAMREAGIRASKAAVSMSSESVYIRTVTMPRMSADQLLYNIPYEFNDYITDELNNYVFDYAMITDLTAEANQNSPDEDQKAGKKRDKKAKKDKTKKFGLFGGGKKNNNDFFDDLNNNNLNNINNLNNAGYGVENGDALTMDLMVVASPKAALEEARAVLRAAGLKLAKAAPSICGLISLIRQAEAARGGGEPREYCVLDLGCRSIRMHMFKGERHMVTRSLEIGLDQLDSTLANIFNIDVHLAHTYLIANHENCQNRDECLSAYNNIAVELMRALNFYRFSNPDSQLADVWLSGGGAVIEPLRNAIADALDMKVHKAEELVREGEQTPNCYDCLQAIGITMEI